MVGKTVGGKAGSPPKAGDTGRVCTADTTWDLLGQTPLPFTSSCILLGVFFWKPSSPKCLSHSVNFSHWVTHRKLELFRENKALVKYH